MANAAFGTDGTDCGWDAGTGDKTALTALGISGDPFDAAFVPVDGLQSVLPASPPVAFPATVDAAASRAKAIAFEAFYQESGEIGLKDVKNYFF